MALGASRYRSTFVTCVVLVVLLCALLWIMLEEKEDTVHSLRLKKLSADRALRLSEEALKDALAGKDYKGSDKANLLLNDGIVGKDKEKERLYIKPPTEVVKEESFDLAQADLKRHPVPKTSVTPSLTSIVPSPTAETHRPNGPTTGKADSRLGNSTTIKISGNNSSVKTYEEKRALLLNKRKETKRVLNNLHRKFKEENVSKISEEDSSKRIPVGFVPLITEEDKRKMINLLSIFDRQAKSLIVSYSLLGGSLLGAYRHDGIIPWDDDIDLMMAKDDREKLFNALAAQDGYSIHADPGSNEGKFFPENGKKVARDWNWPYLDVFFYDQNQTHIIFGPRVWNLTFAKSSIFPFKRTKFSDFLAPVPKDTKSFLQTYFGTDNLFATCKSNSFLHMEERKVPSSEWRSIPCDELRQFYYFADRVNLPML